MTEETKQTPQKTYAQYEQQIDSFPAFNYDQFYADWKEGGKPIVDAILNNYAKPEPHLTPEQVKRAKFSAAMTDSLSSLAEMFAHGQGAHIRDREGNASTKTTNARLKELQDKYDKDILQYGAIKSNAEMQDFNQRLKAAMDARGEERQWLLYKAKNAQDEQDRKQKQTNWEKEHGLRRQQVALQRASTARKDGSLNVFIPLNPKDKNQTGVVSSSIGVGRIEQIPVYEVAALANEAIRDQGFIKSHPEIIKKYATTKIDPHAQGGVAKTPEEYITDKNKLAELYRIYLYNKEFEDARQPISGYDFVPSNIYQKILRENPGLSEAAGELNNNNTSSIKTRDYLY